MVVRVSYSHSWNNISSCPCAITKIAVSSKIMSKGKEKISIPWSLSFLRRMTVEMWWLFHFCDECEWKCHDYLALDVKKKKKKKKKKRKKKKRRNKI